MQACEVGRLAALQCFREALGSHAGSQTNKDVTLADGARMQGSGEKKEKQGRGAIAWAGAADSVSMDMHT